MSVQLERHDARAQIHLRVPRGAAGDMTGGVREVLEKVDAVAAVDVASVDDVTPAAADLYVDVTADLDLAVPGEDTDAVAAALCDGFGIERVDALVLNHG